MAGEHKQKRNNNWNIIGFQKWHWYMNATDNGKNDAQTNFKAHSAEKHYKSIDNIGQHPSGSFRKKISKQKYWKSWQPCCFNCSITFFSPSCCWKTSPWWYAGPAITASCGSHGWHNFGSMVCCTLGNKSAGLYGEAIPNSCMLDWHTWWPGGATRGLASVHPLAWIPSSWPDLWDSSPSWASWVCQWTLEPSCLSWPCCQSWQLSLPSWHWLSSWWQAWLRAWQPQCWNSRWVWIQSLVSWKCWDTCKKDQSSCKQINTFKALGAAYGKNSKPMGLCLETTFKSHEAACGKNFKAHGAACGKNFKAHGAANENKHSKPIGLHMQTKFKSPGGKH